MQLKRLCPSFSTRTTAHRTSAIPWRSGRLITPHLASPAREPSAWLVFDDTRKVSWVAPWVPTATAATPSGSAPKGNRTQNGRVAGERNRTPRLQVVLGAQHAIAWQPDLGARCDLQAAIKPSLRPLGHRNISTGQTSDLANSKSSGAPPIPSARFFLH